jgi:hypothetical protein
VREVLESQRVNVLQLFAKRPWKPSDKSFNGRFQGLQGLTFVKASESTKEA